MSDIWQDPRWVTLARRADFALGTSNDATVRAILAQWACEQGASRPYPPVHDNPGNLTRLIGSLGGPPPPLATTAPGAGFLYAYSTPEAGTDAYARYLLSSSRYPAAIAAARRGDAVGFLTAVCNGGYGTRLSCCLSVLPDVTLPAPAPAPARFRCVRGPMRVRTAPSLGAAIVGLIGVGSVVSGSIVTGGQYSMPNGSSTLWLETTPGRYSAALGFERIS